MNPSAATVRPPLPQRAEQPGGTRRGVGAARGGARSPVEVAAYHAVSEVLTNAAKHGHASSVTVRVEPGRDLMRAGIRDDGVGGGSGLVGLKDRSGTSISIELPLRDDAGASPHGS